jgi:hypothetical protein
MGSEGSVPATQFGWFGENGAKLSVCPSLLSIRPDGITTDGLVRNRDPARKLSDVQTRERQVGNFHSGSRTCKNVSFGAHHSGGPRKLRATECAHMIEREFQVLKALEGTGLPASRALALCEEEA